MPDIVPYRGYEESQDVCRSQEVADGTRHFDLRPPRPRAGKGRVTEDGEGRGQPELRKEGIAGLCHIDGMCEVVVRVAGMVGCLERQQKRMYPVWTRRANGGER